MLQPVPGVLGITEACEVGRGVMFGRYWVHWFSGKPAGLAALLIWVMQNKKDSCALCSDYNGTENKT